MPRPRLLTLLAFVLYTVCRECLYAINLRQAYLLSPFYANRLSSKTVLFTCVPEQLLDEAKLRKVFGDSVKNVWIPKASWELERLVRERDQTASRLQDAELELVRKANFAWRRIAKQGHPDVPQPDLEHGPVEQPRTNTTTTASTETMDEKPDLHGGVEPVKFGPEGPPFDVPGSIAAQWIPQEERPVHRPLANFGRRVDTIRWTRKRLKKLGKEIAKVRKRVNRGDAGSPMPAAFIEFTTQNEAQVAYQSLAHHRPSHMSQRYIGVRPYEIIWFSLRMRWWERIVRRFGIMTATALMTVFWSIPCAFVGMTSNISYLAESIPFLSWIELLPATILGFLTGLLPAFALSLLMAIVPGILRGKRARAPGCCRANRPRSPRKSSGCPLTDPRRAIHATCLLRLPGAPGLPRHHLHLLGVGLHLANHPGPAFGKRAAGNMSPQSIELLPVVHDHPMSWRWGNPSGPCLRPL